MHQCIFLEIFGLPVPSIDIRRFSTNTQDSFQLIRIDRIGSVQDDRLPQIAA
jgi:hypothetical protein